MNGVYNGLFILLLLFTLIGFDYLYTIGDQLTQGVYNKTSAIWSNSITDNAFTYYGKVRDLIYSAVTGVLVPFLIFLSFTSSFINRNQTLISYLISAMLIMLFTPLVIYLFADVMTGLLDVPILNPAYMATSYFSNFMYIMVANMLLSLGSFVFVIRGGMKA